MTNTNTLNIKDTLNQSVQLFNSGADMIRIAVPTVKELDAISSIVKNIRNLGYSNPVIADVHFKPEVAENVAKIVDKVRINPGNYVDSKSNFKDSCFDEAIEKIYHKARPLLKICKEHATAIRIGVNHGSLNGRIVNRYGNGHIAMVESALEWINICETENFNNVVFSMKSSNVRTMVDATTLLYDKMVERGTVYPLHIGVTEAGSGIDGRVKSAIGIGKLLKKGIGDTIRVSLTEPPKNEIVVAKNIIKAITDTNFKYFIEDKMLNLEINNPDFDYFTILAAIKGEELLFSNNIKSIHIKNCFLSQEICNEVEKSILLATRLKILKAEIISCPTCSRTQYNIMEVIDAVNGQFSQFPNLKIAIMGCIVNGPGEMADADFGIMGVAVDKLYIYKGKERVTGQLTLKEILIELERLIQNKK